MSIHPPKRVADLGKAPAAPVAERPAFRWLGFTLTKNFTRCPRTQECVVSGDPRPEMREARR